MQPVQTVTDPAAMLALLEYARDNDLCVRLVPHADNTRTVHRFDGDNDDDDGLTGVPSDRWDIWTASGVRCWSVPAAKWCYRVGGEPDPNTPAISAVMLLEGEPLAFLGLEQPPTAVAPLEQLIRVIRTIMVCGNDGESIMINPTGITLVTSRDGETVGISLDLLRAAARELANI